MVTGMRVFLVVVFIVGLKTAACCQDSEARLGHEITREEVLALPQREKVPTITLQRALKIAERQASRERMNISTYYLFEAKWVANSTAEESGAWHFWWVSIKGGKDDDIRIAVTLDGKSKRISTRRAT
jgi:hypothetical protein